MNRLIYSHTCAKLMEGVKEVSHHSTTMLSSVKTLIKAYWVISSMKLNTVIDRKHTLRIDDMIRNRISIHKDDLSLSQQQEITVHED